MILNTKKSLLLAISLTLCTVLYVSANSSGEKLIETLDNGNLKEAEKLVRESNININAKDEDGYTPLHIAALEGYFKIAQLLIEKGANLNPQNMDKKTPLHLAIEENKTDIIKLLVEKGANISIKNSRGLTAVDLAKKNEELKKIIRQSKFYKEDPQDALLEAIHENNIEKIKNAIKNGANINLKNNMEETPLHIAIQENNLEIARLLIKNGANINLQNDTEESPLHMAIQENNLEMAGLLIENGANINRKNRQGKTALDLAIIQKIPNIIALLSIEAVKKNNIDFFHQAMGKINLKDVKDKDKNSLLYLAVKSNALDIVKFLIKNNVNINAENLNKETPMYSAIRNNSPTVALQLIFNEAKLETNNNNNESPLDIATKNNYNKLATIIKLSMAIKKNDVNFNKKTTISLDNNTLNKFLLYAAKHNAYAIEPILISLGANSNTRNSKGDSPLHIAAKNNALKTAGLLINQGVNIEAKNNSRETPLFYAIYFKSFDIAKLLIDNGADIKAKDSAGNTPYNMNKIKIEELQKGLLQSKTETLLNKKEPLENQFNNRNMIILLESGKNENYTKYFDPGTTQAILTTFLSALEEGKTPMLTTNAIWTNALSMRRVFNAFKVGTTNSNLTSDIPKLSSKTIVDDLVLATKKMDKAKNRLIETEYSNKFNWAFFYVSAAINPDEWIISKIKGHILCIPMKYAQAVTPKLTTSSSSKLSSDQLKEIEKSMGFKENSIIKGLTSFTERVEPTQTSIIQSMNDLFKKDMAIQWFFYIIGHGGSTNAIGKTSIAGVSQKEFKVFLNFLKNNIKTAFLHVVSCYFGGKSQISLFQEKNRNSIFVEKYPFIISSSISQFKPASAAPAPKFYTFLSALHDYANPSQRKKGQPKLSVILNDLFPLRAWKESGYIIYQLPSVRFPNTQWFRVVDLGSKVQDITFTRIRVHAAENRPIIINKKTDTILLHAEHKIKQSFTDIKNDVHSMLPIEIKIQPRKQGQSAPKFIGLASNNASWSIQKINAPTIGFSDLLIGFFSTADHSSNSLPTRDFYLDEVVCANDENSNAKNSIFGSASKIICKRITIKQNTRIKGVISDSITFKYNDKQYHYEWPINERKKLQPKELYFKKNIPLKKEIPYRPTQALKKGEGYEDIVKMLQKRAA